MNPTRVQHPTTEQLTAFAQGRLPPPVQAQVEAHVARCDHCCQALRQIPDDTLVGRLRDADTAAGDVNFQLGPAVRPGAPPPELADHPRYRIVKLLGVGEIAKAVSSHRTPKRLGLPAGARKSVASGPGLRYISTRGRTRKP
jgi:anti-sigma factor RsiW